MESIGFAGRPSRTSLGRLGLALMATTSFGAIGVAHAQTLPSSHSVTSADAAPAGATEAARPNPSVTGGASQVGTQAVATAAPDGYTIGVIDSAFVINPGLFAGKLPYDTRRDFAPVSLLATTPLVLVVHPSVPAVTAQELVALAKAKPGEITFASAGLGTAIHLAGEQFRQVAGVEINHIPYRGGGPSVIDLLAGKVDFTAEGPQAHVQDRWVTMNSGARTHNESGQQMTADHMRWQLDTGQLLADGNVMVQEEGTRISGPKLNGNTKLRKGRFTGRTQVRMKSDRFAKKK